MQIQYFMCSASQKKKQPMNFSYGPHTVTLVILFNLSQPEQ